MVCVKTKECAGFITVMPVVYEMPGIDGMHSIEKVKEIIENSELTASGEEYEQ